MSGKSKKHLFPLKGLVDHLLHGTKSSLMEEHVGIGGLYFISTMVICSFIMFVTVRLSWDSQAVAMADNIAYITAINVAVNGYVDNVNPYSGNYVGDVPGTVHPYSPLQDYNNMLVSMGITTNADACDECMVSWDGKNGVVQFGEFKTALGSWIRPHEQESTIEEN